jgi:hypothetical protein
LPQLAMKVEYGGYLKEFDLGLNSKFARQDAGLDEAQARRAEVHVVEHCFSRTVRTGERYNDWPAVD